MIEWWYIKNYIIVSMHSLFFSLIILLLLSTKSKIFTWLLHSGQICARHIPPRSKMVLQQSHPPFIEFLENGWISSSGGVLLTHSHILVSQYQNITDLAWPFALFTHHFFRLINDLGTSTVISTYLFATTPLSNPARWNFMSNTVLVVLHRMR